MSARKPRKHRGKGIQPPRRLFKRPEEPAIAPGRRGPAIPPDAKIVYNPAGREKMSAVLEEFVEPYRDSASTYDEFRKLLMLGSLAWNAALLPEDKRRAMIEETLEAGFSRAGAADRAAVREIVERLVRRKLEHFAANKRAIVSFELTDRGDDFHLSVASTL
jgi:hypothetical protein